MLHVAAGPFHPSLERAYSARLKELKAADPMARVAVVAPSRRLANRLRELALEAFPRGVANLHFHHLMSFARLAAGGVEVVDDPLVLENLVARIVERDFPKGRYLGPVARNPRLARPLLGVLRELREGGVDPVQAYEALREGHLGDPDDLKLAEIFALQKAYEGELAARGWKDRADLVKAAAERAAELSGFAEILFYGFYELVQVQIDFFREVARRHPCRLYYPLEKGNPDHGFSLSFYDEIVRGLATSSEDLEPAPAPPAPEVVNVSGARDEAWAAAKRILAWRDEGTPFGEIGVVARTLEPWAPHLESVFRAHAIPFASSARVPLERHPYVSAVRTIVSIAADEFPRDAVMDLLASPAFRGSGDPVLWDLATRALGIGRGAAEWMARLDRKEPVKLQDGEVSAAQLRELKGLVSRILEACRPPAKPSWEAWGAWVLEAAGALLDPAASGPAAEQVAAAFEAFGAIGISGAPRSADELREAALRVLNDLRAPVGDPHGPGVQVLDIMSARGLPFRKLVVLGLNEKVFPRYILEEPFLRDGVRARLATRLGARLPQKLRGYDEERLLWSLVRAAAGESLVASYQRSDEAGRVRLRSAFLEGSPKAFEWPRAPKERLLKVAADRLTREEALLLAALEADSTPENGAIRLVEARAVFGWDASELLRGAAHLQRIESARTPGPADGYVGAFEPKGALSPTALENFAECPFRYFARKVLRLEELETPEEDGPVDVTDEGTLLHAILQEYYSSPARDLDRALRKVVAAREAEGTIRHPLLWEIEQEELRRVAEAAIAHDDATRGDFKPWMFELALEGEIGGRRIAGRADRVDLGPGGAFRVVDYKRSSGKYKTWKLETGILEKKRFFQAPLYFLLAEQRLASEGKRPDRAGSRSGYLFLRDIADDAGKRDAWIDGGFWARSAEFDAVLAELYGSIARGEFRIRPDKYCEYCEVATVCRRRHGPTRRRAEKADEDPGA